MPAPHTSHSSGKPLTALTRYALAALSVGAAVLLIFGLREVAASVDGMPALLVAVAISALYLGLGPALLSLALATLVSQDLVVVLTGAVLAGVCASFRRRQTPRAAAAEPDLFDEPLAEEKPQAARVPARSSVDVNKPGSAVPPLEVTTEATWRFQHEKPLDITLPEDEQVEHLYLNSVLAECNDAFARMYGFRSAADVVGTRLVVFLPPSNPENVAYLRSYIRSGYRLEDAESQEVDRYGHTKYFVNNLVGIFERGQLVGSWGTQRDVKAHRREQPQEYDSRLHSTKSSSQ